MKGGEFSLAHQNHTLTVAIILIIIAVIDCRYSSAVTVLLTMLHFYNGLIGFQMVEEQIRAIEGCLEPV